MISEKYKNLLNNNELLEINRYRFDNDESLINFSSFFKHGCGGCGGIYVYMSYRSAYPKMYKILLKLGLVKND